MSAKKQSLAWFARNESEVAIGYGPFTAVDEPPDHDVAFYHQAYDLSDPEPWHIPDRVEWLTRDELPEKLLDYCELTELDPAGMVPQILWSALDAVPFSVVFQEVMTAIQGGAFQKTVPVVTEIGHVEACPMPWLLQCMSRQVSPRRSYGWLDGDHGFAGASPELLFSMEGKHFETMALAGTARSEDQEVFAVDEKEIREHEYVAQSLVAKLSELGSVIRHPREILRLGSIVHLHSRISLELSEKTSINRLIRKMHPTPALGPLPRTPETLAQLSGWRQQLACPLEFGAPFGLSAHGRCDLLVAIRGIWWKDSQLYLPAGSGIIEASRLVNEWRELRLKRESVKQFLS